jgi:predicted Zn-dependent peptidase
VVFGLPEDYFDTYRSRIAGITPADVQRVAHAHLHPESLHIVVAGDPAVLRPELASADVFVLTPDDVEVAK